MSIWWTLHLRREAASVPFARRLLLGTMEAAGVEPESAHDLAVALSEACANAVEHGGGDGSPVSDYCVTAHLDGDTCHIEVSDAGPGFPRRSTPATRVSAAGRSAVAGQMDRAVRRLRRRGPRQRRTDPRHHGTPPAPVAGARAEAQHASTLASEQDEHGRGLFLIEALTDHVRYRNRPDSGAVVSFDKILKWREGAALLRAS